jgi:hypothetical protein
VTSHARTLCTAAALSLLALSCTKTQAAPDAARRPLADPTPPRDLLVSGHFSRPRESVRAIAALSGASIPFELGMSLVLGLDSTMLAAVDLSKPVDLVVTGTPEQSAVTVAFVPQAPSSLRSTLSTRFRLVTVEGVGERLDLRTPAGRGAEGWRCAIVGVPGPVSSRVVCTTREEALATSARWVAFESRRREEDTGDALFEVDGVTARNALSPYLRRLLGQGSAMLAAQAEQARTDQRRPPDLGDPEPLVRQARSLSDQVDPMLADLRRVTVRLDVQEASLKVTAVGELDPEGRSVLAQESARRLNAPTAHPLAGRLVSDAPLAVASRGSAEGARASARAIVRLALDVLGSRVPSADVAATDLDALFAHAGDSMVLSLARGPAPAPAAGRSNASASPTAPQPAPWELTALLSQDDGGVAVAAMLPRLARAPWLRGARLGEVAPTITTQRNAVILRLPPAPRPAQMPAGGLLEDSRRRAVAEPPSEFSIAVSNDALAFVWGPSARDQLRRLDARTAGPVPTVIAAANGPFVAGLDARALRRNEPGAPVRLTWNSTRQGPTLSSRLDLDISGEVLRMLRGRRGED